MTSICVRSEWNSSRSSRFMGRIRRREVVKDVAGVGRIGRVVFILGWLRGDKTRAGKEGQQCIDVFNDADTITIYHLLERS